MGDQLAKKMSSQTLIRARHEDINLLTLLVSRGPCMGLLPYSIMAVYDTLFINRLYLVSLVTSCRMLLLLIKRLPA